MRRLLIGLLAALLSVPVLVVTAPAAHACTCAQTTSASTLQDADLIAEVRVQTMREEGTRDVYRVDVWRAWKGTTSPSVEVSTAMGSTACGMQLELGMKYILIATGSPDQGWSVSSCGGTFLDGEEGSIVTREDIVAEYGVGTVTEAASDEVSTGDWLPDTSTDPVPWLIVAGIALTLVMVVLGLLLRSPRAPGRDR